MQKFSLQITVKELVQCTSNFIHTVSRMKVNNCVFIIGFGSEAVEVTYQDHLFILKIFVSFAGGVKRAHEDESKDELMDT